VQAIKYYKKARKIYVFLGHNDTVAQVDSLISSVSRSSQCGGDDDPRVFEEEVEHRRTAYQKKKDANGEDKCIWEGTIYARTLRKALHTIEAERLLRSLLITSRRVHGENHEATNIIKSELELATIRVVEVKYKNVQEQFQALRYECNGNKCVIHGPARELMTSRHTATVDTNILRPCVGTPVMCHGLKNASHLNGKIGDVRSYDTATWRHGVHFEDKSIEPKCVKPENLRILFELPELDKAS
jgi:hypothetical protein